MVVTARSRFFYPGTFWGGETSHKLRKYQEPKIGLNENSYTAHLLPLLPSLSISLSLTLSSLPLSFTSLFLSSFFSPSPPLYNGVPMGGARIFAEPRARGQKQGMFLASIATWGQLEGSGGAGPRAAAPAPPAAHGVPLSIFFFSPPSFPFFPLRHI